MALLCTTYSVRTLPYHTWLDLVDGRLEPWTGPDVHLLAWSVLSRWEWTLRQFGRLDMGITLSHVYFHSACAPFCAVSPLLLVMVMDLDPGDREPAPEHSTFPLWGRAHRKVTLAHHVARVFPQQSPLPSRLPFLASAAERPAQPPAFRAGDDHFRLRLSLRQPLAHLYP